MNLGFRGYADPVAFQPLVSAAVSAPSSAARPWHRSARLRRRSGAAASREVGIAGLELHVETLPSVNSMRCFSSAKGAQDEAAVAQAQDFLFHAVVESRR